MPQTYKYTSPTGRAFNFKWTKPGLPTDADFAAFKTWADGQNGAKPAPLARPTTDVTREQADRAFQAATQRFAAARRTLRAKEKEITQANARLKLITGRGVLPPRAPGLLAQLGRRPIERPTVELPGDRELRARFDKLRAERGPLVTEVETTKAARDAAFQVLSKTPRPGPLAIVEPKPPRQVQLRGVPQKPALSLEQARGITPERVGRLPAFGRVREPSQIIPTTPSDVERQIASVVRTYGADVVRSEGRMFLTLPLDPSLDPKRYEITRDGIANLQEFLERAETAKRDVIFPHAPKEGESLALKVTGIGAREFVIGAAGGLALKGAGALLKPVVRKVFARLIAQGEFERAADILARDVVKEVSTQKAVTAAARRPVGVAFRGPAKPGVPKPKVPVVSEQAAKRAPVLFKKYEQVFTGKTGGIKGKERGAIKLSLTPRTVEAYRAAQRATRDVMQAVKTSSKSTFDEFVENAEKLSPGARKLIQEEQSLWQVAWRVERAELLKPGMNATFKRAFSGVHLQLSQRESVVAAVRSEQAARLAGALKGARGPEIVSGVRKALAVGVSERPALARDVVKTLRKTIGPDDFEVLTDIIVTDPTLTTFERGRAILGIAEVFGEGRLPSPSTVRLLEGVFGDGFIGNLNLNTINDLGIGERVFRVLKDWVWDGMRASMASFDVSATFRQAWLPSIRNLVLRPKTFWKHFGNQLKAFANEDFATIQAQRLKNHPLFQYAEQKMGVDFTELGGAREEFFRGPVSDWGYIKMSNRAFAGYLNEVRINDVARWLEIVGGPTALTDDQALAIGRLINNSTGRGKLSFFRTQVRGGQKAATQEELRADTASIFLWAPRLYQSRLSNLADFLSLGKGTGAARALPKAVRRRYVAEAWATIGTIAGTLKGIEHYTGLIEVEWDPRSSDFLKAKVGNTRIDPWGGHIQWARLIFRLSLLMGKAGGWEGANFKTLSDGKVRTVGARDLLSTELWFKAAPPIDFIITAFTKENALGKEVGLPENILTHAVPILWSDMWDAYRLDGMAGTVLSAGSNVVGVGASTFDPTKKRKGAKELVPSISGGKSLLPK